MAWHPTTVTASFSETAL